MKQEFAVIAKYETGAEQYQTGFATQVAAEEMMRRMKKAENVSSAVYSIGVREVDDSTELRKEGEYFPFENE